jgi:hypothetical protein
MKTFVYAASAAALVAAAAPAQAERVQTGGSGELTWTAKSMLVGATRTQGGIGETPYTGSMPAYSGTVGLLMNGSVCSGTLLNDRRTILTAAHCVAGTDGKQDVANDGVTVFFRNPGSGPDVQFYYGGPGYTTVGSSNIFVHESYTGAVIDHNDIALVRLSEAAPLFAETYGLYTGEIAGQVANVTGYGSTSATGGAMGVDTVNPNRLGWFRQGLNKYDFALGDNRFVNDATGVNAWQGILGGSPDIWRYSYWSDFDNGLAVNDTGCRITQAGNFGGKPGLAFCDLGTAFGTGWGDARAGLQSSWGEFTGYVPVWLHEQWITNRLVGAVPEPSTWAMMILGFGMVGGALRRRGKLQVRYA